MVLLNLVCIFDQAFYTHNITCNMIVSIELDIIIYRLAWLQAKKKKKEKK